MKLKLSYVSFYLFLIFSITSVNTNHRKEKDHKFVDPLAIHIALGQTQQQTQG